ncbi:MAG: hypothetical protein KHY37_03360 [Actinomyces graevenitzii]|nr:hypothetical protein [Actinomyces graevenitzii]
MVIKDDGARPGASVVSGGRIGDVTRAQPCSGLALPASPPTCTSQRYTREN